MLNTDMSPEIEYFLADDKLETVGEGQRNDHSHYTDSGCRNRQADDET
jgi:hypothetical protein